MRIYIDESGTFAFPEGGSFDVHVLGGVAIPDSKAADVETAVARLHRDFGVDELHGKDLTDDQVEESCRRLAELPIAVSVVLTDTNLVPRDEIEDWRKRQSAKAQAAYDRSRAKAAGDQTAEEIIKRIRKRIELPTRVSVNEFVQFGMVMPETVYDVAQAASVRFRQPSWAADFVEWQFIFDGKLAGKLSAGEKYLKETLPMTLSGDERFVWHLPPEWQGTDHPFLERFVDSGGISLHGIVVGTMAFADSKDHAGLQIADLAVHSLRRAALASPGSSAANAWRALMPVVIPTSGSFVRFFAIRDYGRAEVADYQDLL